MGADEAGFRVEIWGWMKLGLRKLVVGRADEGGGKAKMGFFNLGFW